jgi:hypothetical protein
VWRSTKAALLCAIIVANILILWWRYSHQTEEFPGVGPHVAALGKAQAETVLAWRNSPSVRLTTETIDRFVQQFRWDSCAELPPSADTLSRDDLTPTQQTALADVVAGLINAFSNRDAGHLYDFMTGLDERLSPASVDTLTRLISEGRDQTSESPKNRSHRALFLAMAEKINYGAHWKSLVSKSGCVTIWRAPLEPAIVQVEVPLGGLMAELFKNQTRFHHLFERDEKAPRQVRSEESIFADVQFVVKHDQHLMSEPSAYHIRFVLDAATDRWHPIEMVHVATISGSSPALLF